MLVKLISDSILVGFKTGAGLTIAMTQLPSLFGVPGGGHNFFERVYLLPGNLAGSTLCAQHRCRRHPAPRGRGSVCYQDGRSHLPSLLVDHRLLAARPAGLGRADHRRDSVRFA